MKVNKLTIILIIIILLLGGYIVYDKFFTGKENVDSIEEPELTKLIQTVDLDYAKIHLFSNGLAYIQPFNKEEIAKLNINQNLKDRLTTLYNRSFYYDIYFGSQKLRAFRVKLNNDITKLVKVSEDKNDYVFFLKKDNTLGFFNVLNYYDLLEVDVMDNYNDYENVLDIVDNKIVYLDNSKEDLKIEK